MKFTNTNALIYFQNNNKLLIFFLNNGSGPFFHKDNDWSQNFIYCIHLEKEVKVKIITQKHNSLVKSLSTT